jgi:hypothetical protein
MRPTIDDTREQFAEWAEAREAERAAEREAWFRELDRMVDRDLEVCVAFDQADELWAEYWGARTLECEVAALNEQSDRFEAQRRAFDRGRTIELWLVGA